MPQPSTLLPASELFDALAEGRFDEIIDVRSPSEFAEDHTPGAVNLPVLDDAERAEVGTIYVQESKFRARKIGAAKVSRNIARHLETHFADKPGNYRPLIQCWRGGQRSGAMTLVLRQVGWTAMALEGGYRAYRRHVANALYSENASLNAVLIDGPTGSGKTALLRLLAARGRAVIDLEELAAHRGSIFGGVRNCAQPSQKMFESALFAQLPAHSRDVVAIEAEASRIGDRTLPPALWKAMCAAPVIQLDAPLQARAQHLREEYAEIAAAPDELDALLGRLPSRHGHERVAHWRALAAEGALQPLIEDLVAAHYDPAYAKTSSRRARRELAHIRLERIDGPELERAAEAVESVLDHITSGTGR